MIIHVVKEKETIQSISDQYKMPVSTLIEQNGITNPNNLVIGQTIVIVYPQIIYTVQASDTLRSIANKHQVSIMHLLRNNPKLSERDLIPGENIIIYFETSKSRSIVISGYIYPNIEKNTLIKTLPFLTYLTIYNYRLTKDGKLTEIDDQDVIQLAKNYGVAPMMFISVLSESGIGDKDIANSIMNSIEIQDQLFDNIINLLKKKGYYGVNQHIQYLNEENYMLIENYIKRLANRLHEEGFRIILTIAPRMIVERTDIIIDKIDYSKVAQYVDAMLFLSYEWGFSYGPVVSVTPLRIAKDIISDIVKQIPPDRIFLGMPVIGYDWRLPYITGITQAEPITTARAIELAVLHGVSIQYNDLAQAPYFFYTNSNKDYHIVWFKDARSIDEITSLISTYKLQGLSIWNVMDFFEQLWLIINCKYEIEKIF